MMKKIKPFLKMKTLFSMIGTYFSPCFLTLSILELQCYFLPKSFLKKSLSCQPGKSLSLSRVYLTSQLFCKYQQHSAKNIIVVTCYIFLWNATCRACVRNLRTRVPHFSYSDNRCYILNAIWTWPKSGGSIQWYLESPW